MLKILSLVLLVLAYVSGEVLYNEEIVKDDEFIVDPLYGQAHPNPRIDIFPPKYHPGDLITEVRQEELNEALNDVMRAGDLLHDRRCAIAIANVDGKTLSNPKWAFTSGGIHTSLPQQVTKGQSSLGLFLKTKGGLTGTVGIISYDIDGTNHKVVVFWSVPFDRNIYNVKVNVKVYDKSVETNKKLSRHLEDDGGPLKPDGWHTRTEFGVRMETSITDNSHAKLIVFVNSSAFDSNGDYDLFTECSYHPWRIGKFCNQECYGGGWCWVDKKCKNDGDCKGRHKCNSGC